MKLLIHKEKREMVDGREHIVGDQETYFVTNLNQDVQTKYGMISKEDLKKPSGTVVMSKSNKPFYLLDADFIDIYKRFKKLPQTIPSKDIGLIIAETGVDKNSIVVDGGVGSGALAAALARIVKEVISYDVREDCIATAQENYKLAGVTNAKTKHQSLYDGIDEKNVDLITLDVPEPWKVIIHAVKALRVGGFLVSYSPSIPQVQDFCNEIAKQDEFFVVKTVEIIERLWEIEGRKVRPKSTGLGHSGFLTFARKIKS